MCTGADVEDSDAGHRRSLRTPDCLVHDVPGEQWLPKTERVQAHPGETLYARRSLLIANTVTTQVFCGSQQRHTCDRAVINRMTSSADQVTVL